MAMVKCHPQVLPGCVLRLAARCMHNGECRKVRAFSGLLSALLSAATPLAPAPTLAAAPAEWPSSHPLLRAVAPALDRRDLHELPRDLARAILLGGVPILPHLRELVLVKRPVDVRS